MLSEPPSMPDSLTRTLAPAVLAAVRGRYAESGGSSFGIIEERFVEIVSAVIARYAAPEPTSEQLELLATIRVEELTLARACSAGSDAAWEVFLTRFRAALYDAAYRIAKHDATARELADGLYSELYGIPNDSGRRVSKLDYYMGRGSLEGWLRTVLSQQYIDRYRSQRKDVSLEEQVESGASFAARPDSTEAMPDARVAEAVRQTLAELGAEERFLLASYYLDQRTLAEIGRLLRVHESTISRKLERLTSELRKRVRKRLLAAGIAARRCDELLSELDVRDLEIDVGANLRQETQSRAFYSKDVCNKDGSVT
jgi:RNA polymerase sigma-70 factor (ECF subfamily)